MPQANIIHIGIMTAVGVGAAQTAASVRAGIARYLETNLLNKDLDPFIMALVPEECLPAPEPDDVTLAELSARQLRMLRLAVPALREVLECDKSGLKIELIELALGRLQLAGKAA